MEIISLNPWNTIVLSIVSMVLMVSVTVTGKLVRDGNLWEKRGMESELGTN